MEVREFKIGDRVVLAEDLDEVRLMFGIERTPENWWPSLALGKTVVATVTDECFGGKQTYYVLEGHGCARVQRSPLSLVSYEEANKEMTDLLVKWFDRRIEAKTKEKAER